ncbi:MAG: hypothetical protein IJK89_12600 [Clostridia bacterium]|nr:hypothetical protein [Clostridia bacterium]
MLPVEFRIVSDDKNEYVIIRGGNETIEDKISFPVDDKTAFEALTNHIHFFDKVTKKEMPYLKQIAECVCDLALGRLEAEFPEKRFAVYVGIQKNESVIFRLHQLWPDEPPYYDTDCDTDDMIIVSRRSE